jgi:hypothetical protein
MSEPIVVKVRIDSDAEKDLVHCMAKMKPTDDDGRVRAITIQDAIREALRRMARAK